jgi:hypothetical protein
MLHACGTVGIIHVYKSFTINTTVKVDSVNLTGAFGRKNCTRVNAIIHA